MESGRNGIHLHNIAIVLEQYLNWFEALLNARMKDYFEDGMNVNLFADHCLNFPQLELGTPFELTVAEHELCDEEILILLLALVPQIRPQLLDIFFTKNTLFDRGFSEFGGLKSEAHGGFIPTAETAGFLIWGNNLQHRLQNRYLFEAKSRLFRLQMLQAQTHLAKDAELSFPLILSDEIRGYFLSGIIPEQSYGPQFPARRISTNMEWEDLIVDQSTAEDLEEVYAWLKHEGNLLNDWGLGKIIKPGFRSLFYGPPGTGKSLAASLLGKLTGREVYRIDLSLVVSKFIGETEKNLATVFDVAKEKKWILFFDEADALFGKRSQASSANDRFANQEVSFLLQRIEDFAGTVILASNFKNNIDAAFMRRFQSVVHFTKPDETLRLRLWQMAFSVDIPVSPTVDLQLLAAQYELTGGEIVNVVRYAALKALRSPGKRVTMDFLLNGIRKELLKDGRMFEQLRDE